MNMTITQAFAQFKELAADLPQDDIVMLSEEWSNYTDGLTKDGELTSLQYQHCPAYGETMPDNDVEFILDAMNVSMTSTSIAQRRDIPEGNFSPNASHWQVQIRRGSVWSIVINYSMGSVHTGEPDLIDVMHSLLMDIQCDEDFQGFCDDMGLDSDSRAAKKMHEAIAKIRTAMAGMFTFSELDDLNTLFEDY
jgi:hypothetical protein